jgi:Subtilase family
MDELEFARIFHRPRALGWPHTLDSPIRYEVWRDFALYPNKRIDLLLQVETKSDLLSSLSRLLAAAEGSASLSRPALSDDIAAVEVSFDVFFDVIVGQTDWKDLIDAGETLTPRDLADQLAAALSYERDGVIDPGTDPPLPAPPAAHGPSRDLVERFRWFILLVARLGYLAPAGRDLHDFPAGPRSGAVRYLHQRFAAANGPAHGQAIGAASTDVRIVVLSVSLNRPASVAVMDSRATVKADAVGRLFNIDCTPIGWAVLDSGIDATHYAFRKTQADGKPYPEPFGVLPNGTRVNLTRVEETWDLRTARDFFVAHEDALDANNLDLRQLGTRTPMVSMDGYMRPTNDHGTHVAGILGGNWLDDDGREKHAGVCPDLRLYDLRVLKDNGEGDEFSIIAGLRLVKAKNDEAGRMVIHGVNLSLSMIHHVANYACGWTPVCQACEDLIDSGVVVVAAAGNAGFSDADGLRRSDGTGYNVVSISDPGNAEKVITVGATHTTQPHRYGTSYFSARGPTADGRPKPDLLAPGEGITGPVPSVTYDDLKTYDGTSQAAPHVSGAAALLLGRYRELWGRPDRVKAILCDSATDLGRERYFQGHGLLDVLRALQSI